MVAEEAQAGVGRAQILRHLLGTGAQDANARRQRMALGQAARFGLVRGEDHEREAGDLARRHFEEVEHLAETVPAAQAAAVGQDRALAEVERGANARARLRRRGERGEIDRTRDHGGGGVTREAALRELVPDALGQEDEAARAAQETVLDPGGQAVQEAVRAASARRPRIPPPSARARRRSTARRAAARPSRP